VTTSSGQVIERQAVFGGADGLTLALGLIVSLSGQPHAIIKAALGAGLAELVGMTAGCWLSDSSSGPWPALANGAAALVACVIPALPYVALSGLAALGLSVGLVVAVAAVIAWLRPERGVLAVVQTFGILAVAALLCYLASLI
jgi:VIT1/CCC1 family predicted Fe2+/Mn2+ transporter